MPAPRRAGAEVRDPGRNLPRALVAGALVTTATYLLAAASYLNLFPARIYAS